MRRFLFLLASLAAIAAAPQAAAQTPVAEVTEEWVETGSASRFVSQLVVEAEQAAIARYGPFRVLDEQTFALVDIVGEGAPAQFQAMLGAHPQLATMRFIEAPGTVDDRANLQLGRMIRAAGLVTEVPADGSVRSGAVELVVAGAKVRIDDQAEFAVHAWLDDEGLEAGDYGADSAEHRRYLDYYRSMGMSGERAAAFYAMTNSVGFDDAKWLGGREMRGWLGTEDAPALPSLDYGSV